jgi:hypothetical protein
MSTSPLQTVPFQTALGLGQLLDRVFRLYRLRFGKLVLTAAIFFVPFSVLAALLLGITMNSYFGLLLNAVDLPSSTESAFFRASGAMMGLSLLAAGVGLVLGALAFLSLLAQADANVAGRELAVGASVRAGLSRFWAFIGLTLLASLILIGVMLVVYFGVIVVALIFAGVLAGLASLIEGNSIVAVGAVLLIVALVFALLFLILLPVVYLTTRWFVAPVVILTERCGPLSALKRSWSLTDGSFWRLFGLLVLMFILNSVVLGLPLSLLQMFAAILMTSQMVGVVNGVLTGLSYLVNTLWYPFLALTLVLVYYDLRVRKENLDLDMRIQALELAVRSSTALPSTALPSTARPPTLPLS